MPTRNAVQIDTKLLTQLYWEERNPDGAMIADFVAPCYYVGQKQFRFAYYQDGFFSSGTRNLRHSSGTKFVRIDAEPTTIEDETEPHGVEAAVDRDLADTAPAPLDLYSDRRRLVDAEMDIWVERLVTDVAFAAASWTNGLVCTGGNEWSLDAPTTPIMQQIYDADNALRRSSGHLGNEMVFGPAAWQTASQAPQFAALIPTYERRAAITPKEMETYLTNQLGHPVRVLIGQGVRNTAEEGLAEVRADIWGDNVLYHYNAGAAAPVNSLTSMRCFCAFKQGPPTIVEVYDDDDVRARVVRLFTSRKIRVVCARAGYLFSDVTA